MMHPAQSYRLWRLGVTKQLAELRRLQWAPEQEITALSDRRLRALLRHAHAHVPYYRTLLEDCGAVDAGGNVDLEAFTAIPFLTKDIIRARPEELLAEDLDRSGWVYNYSGGSTGEPVRFAQVHDDWSRPLKLLYDEWSGRRLGDKCVLLWGSQRDLVAKPRLRTRIHSYTRRLVPLNAFSMTPERMREYVATINSFKPRQILGYAGSLYELARFARDNGLRVHSPVGVMTSAETLFPEQRALLEEVFRAPVFNRYGSREAGNMACECDHHRGLHISAPTHLVELVKGDGSLAGPGEMGEIAVTCFDTLAMPLVRYRIGDIATWSESPCSCGRAWPLLEQVNGRVLDAFLTPSGGSIDGCYFTMGFFGRDWLEKFQVVQESPELLRVAIILREPRAPDEVISADLAKYDQHVRTVLGPDCRIEYEFVDAITPTPQGKHRYTISMLTESGAEFLPAPGVCRPPGAGEGA
jgi:phenylacetate-CoA ligase